MTKQLVEEIKDQFKGIFPKENLPKDALLFIPLSPAYYAPEMKDGAPAKLLEALQNVQTADISPSEKMEVIAVAVDQLKKMALYDPLREKLIDDDAVGIVASAVAKCPMSEEGALHTASFLSNMTIYTFKHHPGSEKHMRRIDASIDAILDTLAKILDKYSHIPTVMHAVAYSLENVAAHESSCRHLLQPELPRTDALFDFLIKNARGETEAQNSPISKKCIDTVERVVTHAVKIGKPVEGSLLPGVSAENAQRILDTLFKWHIEYYPWSWAHKPAIQQMMPETHVDYVQAQVACTAALQKWSMNSAFGESAGDVDATGRTPNHRPPVWDAMVEIANGLEDLPESQCYVKIEQRALNVALFSVAPTPEIAYEYNAAASAAST